MAVQGLDGREDKQNTGLEKSFFLLLLISFLLFFSFLFLFFFLSLIIHYSYSFFFSSSFSIFIFSFMAAPGDHVPLLRKLHSLISTAHFFSSNLNFPSFSPLLNSRFQVFLGLLSKLNNKIEICLYFSLSVPGT